ncbi:MAG: protocatechuate 3,4-dioxygenase [Proteobacteria bacterium]|nr:protocatechuate 3,4-dioxygenase [Pseudomonadota bacterium]
MTIDRKLSRRRLVTTLAAGAAMGMALPAGAASLMATPHQNEGPFYPVNIPLDHDSDLVQVTGHAKAAAGDIVHLFGRVLDSSGSAIAAAKVEIWQCDSEGRYHHPGDSRGPADPDFQGYGMAQSRYDGAWRFRTIKPVPYSGRAPHIHFIVSVPGHPRLTTQMYLAGHPRNREDSLYRSLGSDRERESVTVSLAAAPKIAPGVLAGNFDIVIGGNISAG